MLYKTLMLMSRIIRLLPYDALLFAGKVLGHLYYKLVKKQRERAVAQMMPAWRETCWTSSTCPTLTKKICRST